MSKKKQVFMILGAVLGFILNSVFSGVAVSAIKIYERSINTGLIGFTFMMLFSFLSIVASGFFVERVSFRTRKMSAKSSSIFTASLSLAFGLIYSFIMCAVVDEVIIHNYGYYNIEDSETIAILILLSTHLFGFGIGFFTSKLLATLSKKAPGVALADEPRVVMEQGDLFIAGAQQKPREVAKDASQPEKKMSYLEEYKKNMYRDKKR